MNFFDMGFMELLVVLVVILLVFGPEKLPEIARSFGKTINTIKKMSTDMASRVRDEIDAENKASGKSDTDDTKKNGSPHP